MIQLYLYILLKENERNYNKISSKSETMFLRRVECSLRVRDETNPMRQISGSCSRLREVWNKDQQKDWCGISSDVVKKELSQKARVSIYWSIYILTLIYGHEL